MTSRSFGSPAVVVECAAPLLQVGGRLLVSEPPEETGRWLAGGLAQVGLGSPEARAVEGFNFIVCPQVTPCPERFPRRPRSLVKHPLF